MRCSKMRCSVKIYSLTFQCSFFLTQFRFSTSFIKIARDKSKKVLQVLLGD